VGGSDRLPTTEPIESPMQQRPKIWRVYTRRGKGLAVKELVRKGELAG